MGIVWVVDSPKVSMPDYVLALMGNFPVRMIGSLESAARLLLLESQSKPSVFLVNLEEVEYGCHYVREFIQAKLPGTPVVTLDLDCSELNAWHWPVHIKPNEIVARVRRILGGHAKSDRRYVQVSGCHLDVDRMIFVDEDTDLAVHLPPKEAKILVLLMYNYKSCVSRSTIKNKVYDGQAVSDRTIDSHVSRLRKRLEESCLAIDSVYGDGYLLR